MTEDKIKMRCAEISVAFANYVDAFNYDKLVTLFTKDGVLDRRGVDMVEGVDAIKKTMNARDPMVRTRHVCTNILVDVQSKSRASGVTYFTLFRGRQSDSEQTLPLDGPAFVGEYHDEFHFTPQGWKIARRNVRLVFQREEV
jgi:3-phenylpropionate/cinnamic acid dioxygenase small subunit